MAGQPLITFALVALATINVVHSQQMPKFRQISNDSCTCPGHILTFECTVVGGFATIWSGSALGCEIYLVHGRYNESDYNKTCSSNKNIIGGNVFLNMTEDGAYSYRSQLNIIVNTSMFRESIECSRESGNTTVTVTDIIGSHTIYTDGLSPPGNVRISNVDISLRQLRFDWNPVGSNCPAIHYKINASNCGSCPAITNHTNATCTGITIMTLHHHSTKCTFAVQTVICGNLPGDISNQLLVESDVLEVPTQRYIGVHFGKVSKAMLTAGAVSLVLAGIIMTVTVIVCCRLRSKSKITSSDIRQEGNTRTLEENMEQVSYEYSQLEDVPLDLNSLQQILQGQISKQWYQFGLSLGIPMDVLEGFNLYSEEDCLVEVLDYWLKHHPSKPTWQEITDAQRKIKTFNAGQNEVTIKKTNQEESIIDVPPPKPQRRSSSVTNKFTAPKINDCNHEYECID